MTSLITRPIRLSIDVAVRATKLGVGVVRTLVGVLEPKHEQERAPWPVREEERVAAPAAPAAPAAAPARPAPARREPIVVEAPIDFDAPAADEGVPAHIDVEETLAYEAGPAEDVGAVVHVDAPWEGYDAMRAADIVARLGSANDATRAVVRLYEQQGKARSSVLAAAG